MVEGKRWPLTVKALSNHLQMLNTLRCLLNTARDLTPLATYYWEEILVIPESIPDRTLLKNG